MDNGMDSGIRNTLIGIAGFIAMILGMFLYTFFDSRDHLTDEQYAQLGYFGFDQPRVIASFDLLNEDGETVSIEDLRGEWSLLFFGFTYCPDICPTTMGVLNRAVQRMEKDPQVVLVSVDPERDRPEQLKRYVDAFNPEFEGFTGTHEEITKFATQVNVAFGKVPGREPGTYTVDHSASIVVIDPEGRYAGFIKAPHNDISIKRIVESLI